MADLSKILLPNVVISKEECTLRKWKVKTIERHWDISMNARLKAFCPPAKHGRFLLAAISFHWPGVYTNGGCIPVGVFADEKRKVGKVGHVFEGDGLDGIHGEHLSPLGLFPQGEMRKATEKCYTLYRID